MRDEIERERRKTHREDPERVPPHVILVSPPHIMDPNEQRVIHHAQLLQQLRIPPELLCEQSAFLRAQLERLAAVDPVEVLQYRTRVLRRTLLRVLTADGRALEIVRLVDVLVRGEEVVHDHEVDFASVGKLDAVEAVEARDERVWIVLHMLVVLLQDLPQVLVLGMMDGLDDEAVVAREVEERSRLARRAKL